ncbi:Type IV secretion system protein virB1 [Erwinia aphidicola]|uniref:lytic transglycosylase domain-containing protein n=1 Tax=Erwinia aphidicola TaxID=68334 RepID=UPI001D3E9CE8|nr:lytic transglycosylase domain-containing protein [Erwinia aphidicola]CAH0299822.1 Type IV secretion system protein virB1 [Erwinia aphidicola]
MLSTSAFVALAMQCATSVHPDTAQEVARVESGYNPYAIAEIIPKDERKPGDSGVITHLPLTKEGALQVIKRIESTNRRFSVGLMQITSTNFIKYGVNAEKLLNPCPNLSVFEKILVDCYHRGGSLQNALSCYYSGNFVTGKKTEPTFNNTSYTQRIGFKNSDQKNNWIVPSVKEEIHKENNQSHSRTNKPTEITVYPQYAMRGAVSDEKETNDVENE